MANRVHSDGKLSTFEWQTKYIRMANQVDRMAKRVDADGKGSRR